MCFDRMDPARCSAVAVIQPVSELLPPRNLRLDCGWPNIARPALRCATNLSVVRWLCRSGFMRVYGMRNSLRSPRPLGPGGTHGRPPMPSKGTGGFQLSQFYPSPKLGQLFYPAEISVNISVNTRVSSKGRCATASGPPTPTRSRASTLAEMSGIVSEYIFSECTFCEGRCWSRQPDYASIRPTRFLTVGSALSWASVLPFSWVG